jgi:hypothetical protein
MALNLSLEHPIDLDHKLTGVRLIRLEAPNATAKTGERLGGATIAADGDWQASSHEAAGSRLHLPPASAALMYP